MPRFSTFVCVLALLLFTLVGVKEGQVFAKDVSKNAALISGAQRDNNQQRPRAALKKLNDAGANLSDDNFGAYHEELGRAHFTLRDFSAAEQAWGKASKREDATTWVKLNYAKVLHVLGRWTDAAAVIENTDLKEESDGKEAAVLKVVINGPFKEHWKSAYKKLEATSENVRYSVISDVGMNEKSMKKLEGQLAELNGKNDAAKRKREQLLAPHEHVVGIADFLESISDEFLKTLGLESEKASTGKAVFRVFLFSNYKDYAKLVKKVAPETPDQAIEGLVGLYSSSHKFLAVRAESSEEKIVPGLSAAAARTLIHEAWHQVFDSICMERPMWLDEGLAEFFGNASFKGKLPKLGVLIRKHEADDKGFAEVSRFTVIRKHIRENSTIKLTDFFKNYSTVEAWHQTKDDQLLYAQAWSLAYYAMRGDNDEFKKAYLAFISGLLKGEKSKDLLSKSFPKEKLKEYEKSWKIYFRKLDS